MPVDFWSLPCMADIYVQFSDFTFYIVSNLFQVTIASGFHLFPIPNREVKPGHADGTASSGRVGSCRFRGKPPYRNDMEAFCVYRYNIPLLLRLYILPGTRLLAVQYPPQFTLFYLNSSPPRRSTRKREVVDGK